ncbi:hypothetical protein ACFLXE_04900 [Chloroflexota bacterium]
MVIKTVSMLLAAMLAMVGVVPIVLASDPPELEWVRTFGDSAWCRGSSVQQTSDGGYIIAGNTSRNVWLVKTDSDGNEVWNREFGGSRYDVGVAVQPTSDGGFIITGYTNSYGNDHQDVWLIKTDSSGNELWNRTFGGPGGDFGRYVEQTSDGGYIVVGVTSPPETDDAVNVADVLLIKTDSDGNEVWTKLFDKSVYDDGVSVQQTSDGGYIVAGNTGDERAYEIFLTDVLLIKTDSSGNELWSRIVADDATLDIATSMRLTSDGGCVITGMTAGQGNGEDMTGGILLMKADSDGNVVWKKTLGEPRQDSGSSVQQTSDGGYVIVGGAVESLESGPDGFNMDALILKTDSGGNEVWRITTGGAGDQRGSCVRQTTDGGYIITGYSEEIHIADRKEDSTIDGGALLIKVDGEAGQAIGSDVEGGSGFAYEWVGLGAGMAVLVPGAALMLIRRRKNSITISRNG